MQTSMEQFINSSKDQTPILSFTTNSAGPWEMSGRIVLKEDGYPVCYWPSHSMYLFINKKAAVSTQVMWFIYARVLEKFTVRLCKEAFIPAHRLCCCGPTVFACTLLFILLHKHALLFFFFFILSCLCQSDYLYLFTSLYGMHMIT